MSVIDLREATIGSMQQEIMFLKGQNEAFLKMLSYVVEQKGEIDVPRDFGRLIIGSEFKIVPQEDGSYRLHSIRVEEPPAPIEEVSQLTEEK